MVGDPAVSDGRGPAGAGSISVELREQLLGLVVDRLMVATSR